VDGAFFLGKDGTDDRGMRLSLLTESFFRAHPASDRQAHCSRPAGFFASGSIVDPMIERTKLPMAPVVGRFFTITQAP